MKRARLTCIDQTGWRYGNGADNHTLDIVMVTPIYVSRFRNSYRHGFGALVLSALIMFLPGCVGSALNPAMRTTFLDSHDLVVMTDRMAARMVTDSAIARLTAHGPIAIVLTALKNKTDEIIPPDQGDIFLHRVRALLTAHQLLRRQFIFVLNKTTYEHLAEREQVGAAQLGPRVERLQPGYALQATFYSDTKVAEAYRSDYYLCTFYLTDIHTGRIIWEGTYETKKAIHGGFMD